jgi:diguanylate cyclase (GGDEF)-like protein/PAS domain S-box-containing protein
MASDSTNVVVGRVAAGDPISLEMFRSLVEESLTGVYLIEGERFVYCNPRLAEIFGYTREEMLGFPSVLELIDPMDRDLVSDKLRKRLAGEIDSVEYTVRGVRKDGRGIHLDTRSVRTMSEGRPAVMGSMVDITERKHLEEALRSLSLTDELTGLYNRRGFSTLAERHLSLARRKGQELLLVLADIDGLKAINDTFGHAAGDQVVIDAANVLKGTYRRVDIVARIGGDEFTAFPVEAGPESADILMNRLQDNVAKHNERYTRPFRLSMSVGIGRIDPADCPNVQRLLAEADRELYRRKRDRKERADAGDGVYGAPGRPAVPDGRAASE